MFRRNFLRSLSLGGAFGFLAGRNAHASEPVEPTRQDVSVGSVDLSEMEIIDVHVHQPAEMTLSESHAKWNGSFVNALLPVYDYPGKEELRERLSVAFKEHLYRIPRQVGIEAYMARTYGVKASPEGVDSIQAKHMGGDYTAYIRSIMDREKISAILLQSADVEPVRPKSLVPNDRFAWSFYTNNLIQPDWAKEKGAQQIGDVTEAIDRVLEAAKSNGCVGLEISAAYYRPLGIQKVSTSQADRDLKVLLANEPATYGGHHRIPLYDDPELGRAFRSYQDFLLRHMYVKAGELGLRIIIHSAYPYHHHLAALLSEFPNVYADVSFYSNFPGTLEEVLRAFLGLAPSEKIMHGSDSASVPEGMGYCADNMRRVLAKVLNDYRTHYGWTEKDCEKMARNVLSDNAKRIYGIET